MRNLFSASARGSLWLLLARLTAQGLAVIFVILIARRLSAANFGQFAFLGTILFIGNTFTSFGTDTALIREIAKTQNSAPLVARAFTLQLALSTVWVIATIFLYSDPALLLYSLSLFPLALFSIASAALRAFERMDLFWSLSLINGSVSIVCALLASNVLTLCALLLIGNIVAAFFALWICSASIPTFHLIPLSDFRPLLSLTLPFAALTFFSILTQRLGILSVFYFAGDIATGLYSAAARIVDAMKIGHYAILGMMLPVLSRRAFNAKHELRLTFWMLLSLSACAAGAFAFLAQPILILLFGDTYSDSGAILGILAWSLVPYTVSAYISVDLVARNEEIKLLKGTIISLVIAIMLFGLLTDLHGGIGAARAALISETAQALILFSIAPLSVSAITGKNNNDVFR